MPHTCKRRPGGGGAAVDSLAGDTRSNSTVPAVAKDPGPLGSAGSASADRLPTLAAGIEAAHQASYGAARTALEQAFECGRLLIEAKAIVGHGGSLPWLRQNTSVSVRQSQKYMRLAQRWSLIQAKCELGAHFTLAKAMMLLAEPKDDASETETAIDYEPLTADDEASLHEQLGRFLDMMGLWIPPDGQNWAVIGCSLATDYDIPTIMVEIAPAYGGYVYLTLMSGYELSGTRRPMKPCAILPILQSQGIYGQGLDWRFTVLDEGIPCLRRVLFGDKRARRP